MLGEQLVELLAGLLWPAICQVSCQLSNVEAGYLSGEQSIELLARQLGGCRGCRAVSYYSQVVE